ncbi:MAG: AMP-binding protein, partial [Gammaproteobacteria bacterium]|nr:AMP-binding protein [Gammaproteobacteria bacterium]
MTTPKVYEVPAQWAERASIDDTLYGSLYERSIREPDAFWAEQAHAFLTWTKPWHTVSAWDFRSGSIRWFDGGRLNACVNCLDRHLPARADQIAILWESDDGASDRPITYRELHEAVCRLANALKRHGARKGDRICIYLPMIPEAAIAMLACARIGAIHSIVFAGFSAEALKDRIQDADCAFVICADEGRRGGKVIGLKQNVDRALEACPSVRTVFVVRHTGAPVAWVPSRDIAYDEAVANEAVDCEPEDMDAEDPLFILYTSGSTGKPKGVLHTTGGYLLYAAITHRYVFDHRDGDVYWCTADVGWVTGHSYLVYGPLANGATTLLFEGVPTFPDPSRLWQIIDKHRVTIFYTAPTLIRSLMALGDEWVTATRRDSLRVLGSVGEPINPEAWEWYYHVVGEM